MEQNDIHKLIIGFKVRYLRQSANYSYQELSKMTGLSTSYLNDIEKGKKYPKPDKVQALATAFGIQYDDLVSTKASKKIQPIIDLLNSDFFKHFPLTEFGIQAEKLLDVFTNAPDRLNAFISTIIKMVRNYQIDKEHFYRVALRSFQDMHDNHFEDLEQTANEMREKWNLNLSPKVDQLENILQQEYGITVNRSEMPKRHLLTGMRSYFAVSKNILYLNDGLSAAQEKFLVARELSFQYLPDRERPYETMLNRDVSFEKLMSNFRASYTGAAILMPEENVVEDINRLTVENKWSPAMISHMLKKYDVTPEMLLQRLTNVLPHHFGISDIFFIRMAATPDLRSYVMTKELHLSQLHSPYQNELSEQFCQRWVSLNVIKKIRTLKRTDPNKIVIDVQTSKYWETNREYFCISVAQSQSYGSTTPSSVTIGLLITPELRATFNFLKDTNIQTRLVNTTCERCSMPDCDNRLAAPIVVEAEQHEAAIAESLSELD